MKLARYWTRSQGEATDPGGQLIQVVSRGWSDESFEDARNRARERARRLAQRIANDPAARKQYDYDDAPVPEPVVRDFRAGGIPAVVTRNSYGSLVLNSDDLMFADIDQDDHEAQPSIGGLVSAVTGAGGLEEAISGLFSMFGGKRQAEPSQPAPKQSLSPLLDRVQRVADRHGFAVRVYKTAAGYRAMVTDRQIRAGGNEAEMILNEFGSDPMYMRLCRTQQSFRARLTPKPWRCDFRKPPVKFPFEGPAEQAALQRWESEYNQQIARYATCRLVTVFGGNRVHPSFGELIEYHDRETRAASELPLA